jgi:nitrous oxidase accessory protein NosD
MRVRIERRTVRLLAALLLGVGATQAVVGAPHLAYATGNTWSVNGATGTNPATCPTTTPYTFKTIGRAIQCATGGDMISIAGASGSFNGVYCEQIVVDKSLTLQAQSLTNKPTIDGGHGTSTCPAGMPQQSVVTVGDANNTTITVTLLGLVIQNGEGSINSNVFNAPGQGGGIYIHNGVTISLKNSTVRNNTGCTSSCSSGAGGGVFNLGTLTVTNSSVTGNYACNPGCNSLAVAAAAASPAATR